MQAGEDTAELKIKYTQLQLEYILQETKSSILEHIFAFTLFLIARIWHIYIFFQI